MNFHLFASNAAVTIIAMTALWLVSVKLKDASIIDPWWSLLFLAIAVRSAVDAPITPTKVALLSCVAIWSLRLSLHLFVRSIGKPEDPRYAQFRKKYGPSRYWWVSLFQVFWLQGALALFISLPLQVAASSAIQRSIGISDIIGIGLFVIGFGIESVADHQLARFRRDPTHRGRVLDAGLWRFSRHPNYFGEALLWWGFWCFAISENFGWATIVAPALMTFLLVRVSGVTMLDAHLLATKPQYADYIRRTSGFIPMPVSMTHLSTGGRK